MVARTITPLIVIVGPTASGKSDLAMRVAQKIGGEIVCADSRTIYKGMDIGTAKPSREDRALVPHHLLDVVTPDQPFTVAQFKDFAIRVIDDIWARGRWPILVGGSGLYVDAVLFDYQFREPANITERERLNALSIQELQAECGTRGIPLPENKNNKRYLVRTLETAGSLRQNRTMRHNTIVVGLTIEKEDLISKISDRADAMVAAGVVDEVKTLGQKYGWDSEAMKGNIYREFKEVVTGELSLEQAKENCIQSDKRLVKKQLTWFKRNPNIIWGTPDQLQTRIDQFVADYSR